jgi:hypothetical protein
MAELTENRKIKQEYSSKENARGEGRYYPMYRRERCPSEDPTTERKENASYHAGVHPSFWPHLFDIAEVQLVRVIAKAYETGVGEFASSGKGLSETYQ